MEHRLARLWRRGAKVGFVLLMLLCTHTPLSAAAENSTTDEPNAGYQQYMRDIQNPFSQFPLDNIDINGYYQFRYSGRNFSPAIPTDSRWEVIHNHPTYKKLPLDVVNGSPKLEIESRLQFDTVVNDKLEMHYDIEQNPTLPDKYQINIEYDDRLYLDFFNYEAQYKNGEFMDLQKSLNGIQARYSDSSWDLQFATGKVRSKTFEKTVNGSGSRELNLGNKYILEGTLKVWVNNKVYKEGRDYTASYFEGKLNFTDPVSQTDVVKVIYELANPIEDFIPILNRKSFFGTQAIWHSEQLPYTQYQTQSVDLKLQDPSHPPSHNITLRREGLPPLDLDKDEIQALKAKPKLKTNFDLPHTEIVIGSEAVMLDGVRLMRERDYSIRYSKGKLTLKEPISPTASLRIRYTYNKTASYGQSYLGRNTQGPYALEKTPIIEESLKVFLNNIPLKMGVDYQLDGNEKNVIFTYPIQYPNVITMKYEYFLSETVVPKKEDAPYELGISYINESVKTNEDENIIEAQLVSSNVRSDHFFIPNNPLLPDKKFDLRDENDQEIDYTIINKYSGEIQLNEPVSSFTLTYAYQKSETATLFSQGKSSNNGIYRFDGVENDLPDKLPIKYNGVTEIRMIRNSTGEELILNPGEEFTVQYGDDTDNLDGNIITVQFIRQRDLPGSRSELINFPDESDTLIIRYLYVPNINQDDISQTQITVHGKAEIKKGFNVEGNVSLSQNDFSRPVVEQQLTQITTDRRTGFYKLDHTDIVEDSEKVVVIQNGTHQLNSDEDYSIIYSLGQIQFISVTPGPDDKIFISYSYYDNTNKNVESGKANGYKPAVSLRTDYQDDTIKGYAKYITVDKEYAGLSKTRYEKGSTILGTGWDWTFSPGEKVGFDYERNVQAKEKSDLVKDQFNVAGEFRLFDDAITTTQSLHFETQAQAPITQNAQYTNDEQKIDYSAITTFGPDYLKNKITIKEGQRITDAKERKSGAETLTQFYEWGTDATYKNDKWGKIRITPALSYFDETTDTFDDKTSYKKTFTSRTSMEVLPVYSGINSNLSVSRQDIRTKDQNSPTINRQVIRNLETNTSFRPTKWVNGNFNYQLSEQESFLVNQSGQKSTNKGFGVNGTPLNLVKSMGVTNNKWILRPIQGTQVSYSQSLSNTKENNGNYNDDSNADNWSLRSFELLPGLNLKEIGLRTSETDRIRYSSTPSRNHFERDFEEFKLGFAATPKLPILNQWSYEMSYLTRVDNKTTSVLNENITSNITKEETPHLDHTQKIKFQPPPLKLSLPKNHRIDFGRLSAEYTQSFFDDTTSRNIYTFFEEDGEVVSSNTALSRRLETREERNYIVNYSPFNLLALRGGLNEKTGEIQNNISLSSFDKGSTFTNETTHSLEGSRGFFRQKLGLKGSYNIRNLNQYTSSEINLSQSDIENALQADNLDIFGGFLEKEYTTIQAGLTLTPIKFIKFGLDMKQDIITQQAATPSENLGQAIKSNTAFTRLSAAPSLTVYPKEGLSIENKGTLKWTSPHETFKKDNQKFGYSVESTVKYTPLKTRSLSVDLLYSLKFAGGVDLNELDNQTSVTGSGRNIATDLKEVDYVTQDASLTLKWVHLIPEIPYIEDFTLEAEGFLHKVNDHKDDENTIKNTLDIIGFSIKGTLHF